MEYRILGRSGLRVSAIGLGCNPFGHEVDQATADRLVGTALDLGVTYFDTADAYHAGRSEELLGRALGARRRDAIVASKVGLRVGPGSYDAGASRRHILAACDASLRRLRTDYLDLYQLHTPDPDTPMEETLRALDDLVRQGKVRYLGCSNHPAWQVADAQWTARAARLTPFVACQEFYNLLYRGLEHTMLPFLVSAGLGLVPYFPLAGGLLSGTYRRDVPPPPGTRGALRPTFKAWDSPRNWTMVEGLMAFAERRGWSLARLAIAWLLTRPQVATVIAGADRPEHLADNVTALDVHLAEADLGELDRLAPLDEDRSVPPTTPIGRRSGPIRPDPPGGA